jgi:hypothetical protein
MMEMGKRTGLLDRAGLRSAVGLACVLVLAVSARLIWLAYTGFTEEDAFIVFRFARNLAAGNGFVFNTGERVYGSTTPLYTFLLAIGRMLTGARLVCIAAALGALILLDSSLRRMNLPLAVRLLPLGFLGISTKACLMDTQGLETPLVILLMMASWRLFLDEKSGWSGFCAGLLLWVRIDTLLWPAALAIASCRTDFRRGLRLLAVAGLTYLPWVVFAGWYFGSPVPLTVLAKWAAAGYSEASTPTHLALLIGYFSPLDFGPFGIDAGNLYPAMVAGGFALLLAAWNGIASRKDGRLLAPLVFIVLEFVRLADTRAAIDNRYFFPAAWFVWLLFFLGLCTLWRKASVGGRLARWIPPALVTIAAAAVLWRGAEAAGVARDFQIYRNEASLKEAGLWLEVHTTPEAGILLEPLGYMGFFSGRRMYDDAGLVTPRAVALRLEGVPRNVFYRYFPADYYIGHCDYPENMRYAPGDAEDFLSRYRLAVRIDPLGYDTSAPARERTSILPWAACYVIWERK